jgi:fused signal recognition particle receptor
MRYAIIAVVAVLVLAAIGYVLVSSRRKNVPLAPPSIRIPAVTDQERVALEPTKAPEGVVLDRVLEPGHVDPVDHHLDDHLGDAPDTPEPEVIEPEIIDEVEVVKPRFRDRLTKARSALGGVVGSVLGRSKIDAATFDELEDALILADVGVGTTTALLDDLRKRVKSESISSSEELVEALKTDLKKQLVSADRSLRFEPGFPNVWLFVGVNGVGKTTTIGKIAKQQIANGRTVIMGAGDTFRAAAAEQLGMWAERTGATLVRGAEGGDPGAVIFDAVEKAASKGADLVLGDTAGRLQTKTNLMEELRKIRRVADRDPGKVTEVLLVLDATTGQNGLVQAKQFADVADITGVVLTKLDGTAKGGIAFAIQTELGIPIKLVGLGEGVDDLIAFDPDEYVEALFAP